MIVLLANNVMFTNNDPVVHTVTHLLLLRSASLHGQHVSLRVLGRLIDEVHVHAARIVDVAIQQAASLDAELVGSCGRKQRTSVSVLGQQAA